VLDVVHRPHVNLHAEGVRHVEQAGREQAQPPMAFGDLERVDALQGSHREATGAQRNGGHDIEDGAAARRRGGADAGTGVDGVVTDRADAALAALGPAS